MNRVIVLSSWAQRADKEDTIRFHRHSTHLSKGTKYYDTNACCFNYLETQTGAPRSYSFFSAPAGFVLAARKVADYSVGKQVVHRHLILDI